MALATLTDLKSYIGISGTASDAEMQRHLDAQSEVFESLCGQRIATGSYTDQADGDGGTRLYLRSQPVVSVSGVLIDGSPVPESTDSSQAGWLLADGAVLLRGGLSFSFGTRNITVTYVAGHSTVPPSVQQAVIELSALRFRESSRVGQSTASSLGTSVSFLPSLIPQTVKDTVAAYRRTPSF